MSTTKIPPTVRRQRRGRRAAHQEAPKLSVRLQSSEGGVELVRHAFKCSCDLIRNLGTWQTDDG